MFELFLFIMLVGVSLSLGVYLRLILSLYKPLWSAFKSEPRYTFTERVLVARSGYYSTLCIVFAVNALSLLFLGYSPTVLFLIAYGITALCLMRRERRIRDQEKTTIPPTSAPK